MYLTVPEETLINFRFFGIGDTCINAGITFVKFMCFTFSDKFINEAEELGLEREQKEVKVAKIMFHVTKNKGNVCHNDLK